MLCDRITYYFFYIIDFIDYLRCTTSGDYLGTGGVGTGAGGVGVGSILV